MLILILLNIGLYLTISNDLNINETYRAKSIKLFDHFGKIPNFKTSSDISTLFFINIKFPIGYLLHENLDGVPFLIKDFDLTFKYKILTFYRKYFSFILCYNINTKFHSSANNLTKTIIFYEIETNEVKFIIFYPDLLTEYHVDICFCMEKSLINEWKISDYATSTSYTNYLYWYYDYLIEDIFHFSELNRSEYKKIISYNDFKYFECRYQITMLKYKSLCMQNEKKQPLYYERKELYCKTFINEGNNNLIPFNMVSCGTKNKPTECNYKYDCCYNVCIDREGLQYKDRCNIFDYTVLNLQSYCHNICSSYPCPTEGCDGSCVQHDCYIKQCLNTLNAKYSSVCLIEHVGGIHYFTDHLDYCTEAVEHFKSYNFDLNGFDIGCKGEDGLESCQDDDACCYARCLNEAYEVSCVDELFEKISHETYCEYRCDPMNPRRSNIAVDQCNDNDGNIISCESCNIFICLDYIAIYPSTTICIQENSESLFYASHVEYCSDKNMFNDTNYAISNDVFCDGNSCENSYDCCYEICLRSKSFKPGCEYDTYDFVDLDLYCRKKCSGNTPMIFYCKYSECNHEICAIEKCMKEFTTISANAYPNNNRDNKKILKNREEYCKEKVYSKIK